MFDHNPRATGSCLCGSVRFSVHGELRDVVYCHCLMCQRALTHFGAFTACAPKALRLEKSAKLKWYRSSPEVQRGFCGQCGSQLFWAPEHGRHVSISAGSLDQPTHLRAGAHQYLDQAADYDRTAPHASD
ncbi:MAG TPA: GFA family protein [Roseiarcus sp.]|nr:GFA family protein [Roseiarcus sp.]